MNAIDLEPETSARVLPPAPALTPTRRAAWVLPTAIAGVIGWYFAVNICLPHVLGDEMYHFPMVQALARGEIGALISQGKLDELMRHVSRELEKIR